MRHWRGKDLDFSDKITDFYDIRGCHLLEPVLHGTLLATFSYENEFTLCYETSITIDVVIMSAKQA